MSFNKIILVLLTLNIIACGGGGTSNATSKSTPPPPPPPPSPDFLVTVDDSAISLAENEVISIPVSFTGAQGEVSFDGTIQTNYNSSVLVSADINSETGVVTLQNQNMMYDSEGTVRLLFTDGDGRTQTVEVTLNLVNTSGNELVERYRGVTDHLGNFIDMKEELALISKLSQLALMTNSDFDSTEQASIKATIKQNTDENVAQTLLLHKDIAIQAISFYRQGNVSEENMWNDFDELMALADQYAFSSAKAIHQVVASTNGLVPDISLVNVSVDETSMSLSQFAGNESLGRYVDGKWVFKEKYAFLKAIVYPANQPCIAE
jgi:hypothetical protein